MSDLPATQGLELTHAMAERAGVTREVLIETVKKTVFGKSQFSNTDVLLFFNIAKKNDLDPLSSEIYAIQKKQGGFQVVVSVDGWLKLANNHAMNDGIKVHFNDDENGKLESATCTIYRKDRSHPTEITEYLSECYVAPKYGKDGPWQTHPHRMLRHKAIIQAARIAFSFADIMDPDEAQRLESRRSAPLPPPIPETKTVIDDELIEPSADETINLLCDRLGECERPEDCEELAIELGIGGLPEKEREAAAALVFDYMARLGDV